MIEIMAYSSWTLTLAVGLAILFISRIFRPSKIAGHPPLPPGPKGLPLLGNLNDLPKPGVLEAHHWLKHKDLYGTCDSMATAENVSGGRLAEHGIVCQRQAPSVPSQ